MNKFIFILEFIIVPILILLSLILAIVSICLALNN